MSNDLLQHEPQKMSQKQQPRFILDEATKEANIRKDLAVVKFKSKINNSHPN